MKIFIGHENYDLLKLSSINIFHSTYFTIPQTHNYLYFAIATKHEEV